MSNKLWLLSKEKNVFIPAEDFITALLENGLISKSPLRMKTRAISYSFDVEDNYGVSTFEVYVNPENVPEGQYVLASAVKNFVDKNDYRNPY